MKKVFIFAMFALVLGMASITTKAQIVTDTAKKVGNTTNQTTKTVVKKSTGGVKKGWYISKRTSKKVWFKSKKVTGKGYKVTKSTVNKVIK